MSGLPWQNPGGLRAGGLGVLGGLGWVGWVGWVSWERTGMQNCLGPELTYLSVSISLSRFHGSFSAKWRPSGGILNCLYL